MKCLINKIFTRLFFIAFVVTEVNAQQYPITHYTRDRGLPGNQIWSMIQDSKGYMWFATSAGLVKYNGKEYKTLGLLDGLMDDTPLDLAEDKSGNLWIAFLKGVGRVKDGKIQNWILKDSEDRFGVYADSYGRVWAYSSKFSGDVYYFLNDSVYNFSIEYNFKNQTILNISEDKEGGIFFFTKNGKLFRFFMGKISEILLNGVPTAGNYYSFFDSEGNLILCTQSGLGIISNKNLYTVATLKWLTNVPMYFGLQTKKGSYWFATRSEGLYRINEIHGDTIVSSIQLTERNGLLSNNLYRLCEDQEGNIWIGYDMKGISKISSLMFHNYGRQEGLDADAFLCISQINGVLICSTERGLYQFNNSRFERIDPTIRWYGCILSLRKDITLLGASPGLYQLEGNSIIKLIGLKEKIIRTLMKDHNNKIWIGTHEGILSLKGENIFLQEDFDVSGKSIRKLLEVDKKDLYIGTDKGLYVVENGTIPLGKKKVIPPPTDNPWLSENIKDMIIDADSCIIVATQKGLVVVDKNNKIKNIDGFRDVCIIVLHVDKRKRLWVGSSSGLFVLDKRNNSYQISARYSQRNGLISNEFTFSNTIFEDINGKIYFGLFGGITVYDPKEDILMTVKPKSYIVGVQVSDSTYPGNSISKMGLSPTQNKTSFLCEALSYFDEDAVKFEYYISPIEKEWSNVSSNPTITYGYLEPNDYTFYVRAVNQFGISSDPQSVSFSILSPFWRQDWFAVVSIIMLVFSGYQINRVRRAQIRKRNLVLERIVNEKTKDLEESKTKTETQYQQLIDAQKELVEKRELEKSNIELEKANSEIQLLKERLVKENIYLRERHGIIQEISSIIGKSPAIQEVRSKVEEIAEHDSTVLITGETGVGKNLVAEAIHGLSARNERTLITVNCAAIPDSLVESELFGHEKGAFTGALERREGKFEVADGSTIFLDEIGDMPLAVQAKVLNVIQSKTFTRVGGNQLLKTDVRIIAATNHDLSKLVKEGKFRQDLFYRVNVYSINIPSLRERREDIEPIAKYFIDKYAKRLNKKISAVTKSALSVLLNYSYPGNIRELENIIHRGVIICSCKCE